jgi:hypothetical protein
MLGQKFALKSCLKLCGLLYTVTNYQIAQVSYFFCGKLVSPNMRFNMHSNHLNTYLQREYLTMIFVSLILAIIGIGYSKIHHVTIIKKLKNW